jgi:hypothetical protein
MSKNELVWQLQDNAVQRFYLTVDLGFFGVSMLGGDWAVLLCLDENELDLGAVLLCLGSI